MEDKELKSLIPSIKMSQPKLYYTPTSCGAANFIVGHLGGVQFDSEQVDIPSHRTAGGRDFYEVNPKGNVPALVLDDGTLLNENVATLTWLADEGKANLSPMYGTPERYRYLAALGFVASELHKAFGPLFDPSMSDERKEAQRAYALSKVNYMMEHMLNDTPFFLGHQVSAADIYAYIVLTWSEYLGINLPNSAVEWRDSVRALPGMDAAYAAMNN